MVQDLSAASVAHDLRALLDPLFGLAETCPRLIGSMAGLERGEPSGRRCDLPRFLFAGPVVNRLPPVRLGLFAGLHGDEPAGCAALVRFLCELAREPERAAGYDLVIYPVCNPTGFEDGTRHNRAGFDLNREFWRGSTQPEVRLLEAELRAHRFGGLITLHADDTCDGVYGYAHGCVINESLLEPALRAGGRVLPRDSRHRIDGFCARDGIIGDCFEGVLGPPPEQRPQPFDVIFETPARAAEERQIRAAVAALHAILEAHRTLAAREVDL